jgi:predicted alpha/beta superfamily hydrolase
MPVCATCPPQQDAPGVPSGGEAFITFLDTVLRPWVHSYFPNVNFDRDGLYGHSFGGLFVIYALLAHPNLFDVFLSASPYLIWNQEYIFSNNSPIYTAHPNVTSKPAFQLTYGGFEEYPQKRRTETQAAYETRRNFLASLKTETNSNRFYNIIKNDTRIRHSELLEYPFSYHAAVGGNALADGIDYFLDW